MVVLLILATGAVIAGREGPLRTGRGMEIAAPVVAELAATGRSVLVVSGGEPARQIGGRLAHYGDDDLAPAAGSPQRLAAWRQALAQGSPEDVKQALAAAEASGVLYVVLPAGANRDAFIALAKNLVGGAPRPPTAGRCSGYCPRAARSR